MGATAPVVVAGAGQAGSWAVKTLRDEGYGGPLVLVGEEQHPPYERPPLSKQVLLGDDPPESTILLDHDMLGELDVEFRARTRITALDRERRILGLEDGSTLAYDRLMITTGARVRRLELPGAAEAPIMYLRTIEDSLAIARKAAKGVRCVVIGGGLIGLEAAAAVSELGCRVAVVEAGERLMARVVGPRTSAYFADLHRTRGIELVLGDSPVRLEQAGGSTRVILASGAGLDADLIVVGIGVVPNAEFAADAGLKVDNGLWVDECGRTEDPRIFAAGDVTAHHNPVLGRRVRLETWQNAQNQAIAAARTLAGSEHALSDIPWGWSNQFKVNLQILGVAGHWDDAVLRGDPQGGSFSLFYFDQGAMCGVDAINAPRDIAVARRLMSRNIPVDRTRLGDRAVPLKDLLKG